MINQEIRNRIRLSVAAYAYEFMNDSIMSDHDYDQLSLQINPQEKTGNELMDKIKQDMETVGRVELQPKFDGKQMIMVIQPL